MASTSRHFDATQELSHDDAAKLFDWMRQYRQGAPVLQASRRLLGWIPPQSVIVDVGPGNGEDADALVQAGHHVVGIDVRDDLVTPHGWELKLGSASDMPVPDKYADVILGNRILHHLRDPEGFLRETQRVLRDNGTLLLAWPDHHVITTSYEPGTRAFQRVLTSPGSYLANPMSLGGACDMITEHGYTIVEAAHEIAVVEGASSTLYALPEPEQLLSSIEERHPELYADAAALLDTLKQDRGWVQQSIAVVQARLRSSA